MTATVRRYRHEASRWEPPHRAEWRTLTLCPVCLGMVHLTPDARLAANMARPAPWARLVPHTDGWGRTCYMSHRSAPPWDEPTTRAAVYGRSMGVCEYCQAERATDMHHRLARSLGGKWHPANIVHLCRGCHARCTSPAGEQRQWARHVGLLLESWEVPADTPVHQGTGGFLWCSDNVTGGLNDEHRPRTKRRNP